MAWQYLATLEQAAPQARYSLQFNNTDETGYKLKTVMGLTEQGRRIEATLSNLESHIKTLYRIIITRTLYFAGKEIRFSKKC